MGKIKAFLTRKNVLPSARRYGVDATGAMAQGLFASLLIGTIIKTLGQQAGVPFLVDAGNFAQQVAGPAMAVSIGAALAAPQLVLFSLIAVGMAANSLGGAGGPLAVYVISIIACECGKMVSKETKVDILVTPAVTVLAGCGLAMLCAPAIGAAASAVGGFIKWATQLQPFLMGVLVSVAVGMALTLPHRFGRGCGGGRLLCADGGLRGDVLPGKRCGRSGQPGAGHLHAANAQYPSQSPHLDSPDAGFGLYRPHRHLPVSSGNERASRVQRHGHLRAGGADRGVYGLA